MFKNRAVMHSIQTTSQLLAVGTCGSITRFLRYSVSGRRAIPTVTWKAHIQMAGGSIDFALLKALGNCFLTSAPKQTFHTRLAHPIIRRALHKLKESYVNPGLASDRQLMSRRRSADASGGFLAGAVCSRMACPVLSNANSLNATAMLF